MTRFRQIALATTLVLATAAAHSAPVTYTFDTRHSIVSFYVNHFGFSNVLGQLHLAPGTYVFDNDDWSKSSVSVTLPVKSLDLGDTERTVDVQAGKWLDMGNFPTITFQSTKLEKTDATHGKLSGNLTIHGVTKPVTLDLRLNKVGEHPMLKAPAAGFTATTVIKRSDYGVSAYAGAIGDDLDVRIEVESSVAAPMAK